MEGGFRNRLKDIGVTTWMILLLCLASVACQKKEAGPQALPPTPSGSLSILCWNLHDYAWQDREGRGQPDDMKPEAERKALFNYLEQTQPDLLLLRGIGSPAASHHLHQSLGTNWQHLYIAETRPLRGISIFGSIPMENRNVCSNLSFRVNGMRETLCAGSVTCNDWSLWNARISPDASYESRRNQVRLIAQQLGPLIQAGRPTLLSIEFPDTPDSPMGRYLREAGLVPLRPADDRNDCWTCRPEKGRIYLSDQMLWISSNELSRIEELNIPDTETLRSISPCRPQHIMLQELQVPE